MDTERYKSQYEVFFLATLLLFPDVLLRKQIDPWFFRPYFNFAYDNNFNSDKNKDPDILWAEMILSDYQKKGYIRYIKEGSLYKIIEIDSKKVSKDLVGYLQEWKQNKLLSLSASKPPDATYQQGLLLNAVARAYATNSENPRITLEDIYGKSDDHSYRPPYWELILSCQLIDQKIKIQRIGYNRNDDTGLYYDDQLPYVDIKIIDEKLIELIQQRSVIPIQPASDKDSYQDVSGIPCNFELARNGIIHIASGDLVYETKVGKRRQLAEFLMDHNIITEGGKRKYGNAFTVKELERKFPTIRDMARELRRISNGLLESKYQNRIFLTLPKKSVPKDTLCQIECRQ